VQDTSVLEVGNLGVSVDSALDGERFATVGGDLDVLCNCEVSSVDVNVELLGASQAEGFSVLAFLELEGQDAHTKEVTSVDTLVALSDDDLDSLEVGALSSPVSGGAGSVLFTGEDNSVSSSFHVLLGSVEDGHLFSGRDVLGSRSSLVNHLVDQTHVSEGSTSHNLVVSSARSVGVEILVGDSTLGKESSSRGVLSNLSSGGDVIGGDGVSHVQEAVGVVYIRDGFELSLGLLEEGRVVDVGGVVIPGVEFTSGGFEVLPHLGSLEDVVVDVHEHLGLDASFGDDLHLFAGGPDIGEEDVFAVLVLADGLGLEVVVDSAGKGVGDDERRGSKVVGTGVRVDSAFEVSVSRKDGGGDHVVIDDSILNHVGDISGVTNAGHASVTGSGETELFEVGLNSSFLEVLSDNVGSGGEGALDVRIDSQAFLDGVTCEHTSLEHDIGVGGVGARGDSSNNQRSLGDVVVLTLEVDGDGLLDVFVLEAESLEADVVLHAVMEVLLHAGEGDSIVGSLGSGKAGDDGSKVELHDLSRVVGVSLRAVVLDEHILLSEVVLNLLDVAFIAASESHSSDGHIIDGEVSHGCSVLGGHVGDGGTVSEGELLDGISEELNELADDSTFTEHLDDSESQISSSGLLRKRSDQSESNDLGKHHGDGLSEHDSFGFDTTDTPSGNTESVNHGGVGVSSDDGVGVEEVVSVHDNTSEVLEVDLMDDTRTRGNNLEVVEGLGSPLQELEALLVSFEFHLFVESSGISSAGLVNLDGMVNDEIDGHEGVNLLGISTETLHSVTHGGEINDGGYTSEVLENDTGGEEWNLYVLFGGLFPVEDSLDIVFLDVEIVGVTDGGLKEDSDGVGEFLNAAVSESGELVVR